MDNVKEILQNVVEEINTLSSMLDSEDSLVLEEVPEDEVVEEVIEVIPEELTDEEVIDEVEEG